MTKNGSDPLISTEENTANLVEPPTEEEVQSAITGNLRYLLTVVRFPFDVRNQLYEMLTSAPDESGQEI